MWNWQCLSHLSVSFVLENRLHSPVSWTDISLCEFIAGFQGKIHTTMRIFIIIIHPCVILNPYDFLSELLFLMKIDGDLQPNSEHLCLRFTDEKK